MKMAALIVSGALLIPVQALVLVFFKSPKGYDVCIFWHSFVCRIFGIRIETVGKPASGQTLFMCSHLSYLDIPALASILKASFLAKTDGQETGGVFGLLTKLQQCPYIERKKTAIVRAKNNSEKYLARGGSLIIFPEGTSTDGQTVLPFKSNLFALAYSHANHDMNIQPVTLEVIEADGHPPISQNDRDLYAWHIAMDEAITIPIHLRRLAQSKGVKLRITFHPALKAAQFEDRKALAKACHDVVINGLTRKPPEANQNQKETADARIQPAGNNQAASLLAG